ncbi:MAG TPA: flagellar protein FliS [Myxococcota bacterium]
MNAAARRYHAVATQTASGERLMILLMHAALSSMEKAKAAIEQKPTVADDEADQVNALVTKALDIVQHLQGTLDVTRAPAVTQPIVDCYAFVVWKLVEGRNQRSAPAIAAAAQVFAPIVDAFDHAVEAAHAR